MSVSAIIIAAVVVGGTGIVIGIILGIAGEKFKVEVDPKEEEVLAALPGNNCGGCGFAGCSGLAAAIAKGRSRSWFLSSWWCCSSSKNRCDHGSGSW